MEEWRVLYTKPRAEFRTRDFLQVRGVDIFLPLATIRRFGKPPQRRPLFPRYLFARLDLAAVHPDLLRWTPGLLRLLSCDGTPARMPEEAIELIRQRLAEWEEKGGLPTHDFQPGEWVRIRSGPLQGLDAIFEGPTRPSQRVTILLDFLSQGNRIEISPEELEPADAAPRPRRGRRTRGRGRRIRGA